MRAHAWLILAVACGGGPAPAGPAPAKPIEPAAAAKPGVQQKLGWLVGRWQSASGIEHWTAAGDALFGASFTVEGGRPAHHEALILRDVGGVPTYEASPDGALHTAFTLSAAGDRGATFVNPAHDPN